MGLKRETCDIDTRLPVKWTKFPLPPPLTQEEQKDQELEEVFKELEEFTERSKVAQRVANVELCKRRMKQEERD